MFVRGTGGEQLVLDAGTGLRVVEPQLDAGRPVTVLLTHYHLDHLVGLPSFASLYRTEGGRVHVLAPPRQGRNVPGVLRRLLSAPFWPVPLARMPALRSGRLPQDAPRDGFAVGGLRVRWAAVHHQDGCHAYRIDEPATGASFVFATDVEWALSTAAERAALVGLCARPGPCRLLAMDGQYTREGYRVRRGWGHSRWNDVVSVARRAGVGKALVTHHAPEATDTELACVEREVAAALSGAGLARQGMDVNLGGVR